MHQITVLVEPCAAHLLQIKQSQNAGRELAACCIRADQRKKGLIGLALEAAFYNREIHFLLQLRYGHIQSNILRDEFALLPPFRIKHIHSLAQRNVEITAVHRLQQIIDYLGADRLAGILKIIVAADYNQQQLGKFALRNLQQLAAAELRHFHIDQDQIKFVPAQHLQPGFSVTCLKHLTDPQPLPVPQNMNGFAQRLLIINNQHSIHVVPGLPAVKEYPFVFRFLHL
ncbi:hypothetical protein D3C75_271790 [compost metagenome]